MLGYSYSITRAPSRGKKEGDLVAWWEEHANDRHRFHSMFEDIPSPYSLGLNSKSGRYSRRGYGHILCRIMQTQF